MALANTRIPARSRRQAMDWSLVLASQGIECTPGFSEEAGWGLELGAQDRERALGAIRQYRLENRRWPWRLVALEDSARFDWAGLAWALLLAVFFWLDRGRIDLRSVGIVDTTEVWRGEWWRLFTAVWLHADLAHLAANATIGFVLFGLALGRYGTGLGLLAAYLAGAAGNVATWLLAPEAHRSLGASGMVMGSLGLLAVPPFSLWRQGAYATKHLLRAVLGGLMLFLLLGLAPGTDILAHSGGFLGGLAFGFALNGTLRWTRRESVNLCAGFVFAALVVLPWWLALRAHHS